MVAQIDGGTGRLWWFLLLSRDEHPDFDCEVRDYCGFVAGVYGADVLVYVHC
jgi:hypothetical protein